LNPRAANLEVLNCVGLNLSLQKLVSDFVLSLILTMMSYLNILNN